MMLHLDSLIHPSTLAPPLLSIDISVVVFVGVSVVTVVVIVTVVVWVTVGSIDLEDSDVMDALMSIVVAVGTDQEGVMVVNNVDMDDDDQEGVMVVIIVVMDEDGEERHSFGFDCMFLRAAFWRFSHT